MITCGGDEEIEGLPLIVEIEKGPGGLCSPPGGDALDPSSAVDDDGSVNEIEWIFKVSLGKEDDNAIVDPEDDDGVIEEEVPGRVRVLLTLIGVLLRVRVSESGVPVLNVGDWGTELVPVALLLPLPAANERGREGPRTWVRNQLLLEPP